MEIDELRPFIAIAVFAAFAGATAGFYLAKRPTWASILAAVVFALIMQSLYVIATEGFYGRGFRLGLGAACLLAPGLSLISIPAAVIAWFVARIVRRTRLESQKY